jgi:cellulose synthase/poly-beta-1,6-N-acetylglucosamine synthase-like glycosyltransferase
MSILIVIFLAIPVAYLTFSVFYCSFLAVSYFVTPQQQFCDISKGSRRRYVILVPAHNEEAIISRLLESVRRLDYDTGNFKVYVIADNCTDMTASISRSHGANTLVRYDEARKGKGFAIEWALRALDLNSIDAVVIVDADSIVEPGFLSGLDEVMDRGIRAVQCSSCVANSHQSLFTKLIHLSRTINNLLYHQAKYKLGLFSYLMGTGMCFTTSLLIERPWKTGTMAEDWEFYALLVGHNEPVGFAVNARLYHQESEGIKAASGQRLRWSSGRFQVARKFGFGLLIQGIRERNLKVIDASLPLLLPNLSLMVNMTVVTLAAALVIHYFHPVPYAIAWLMMLIAFELAYFISGMYLAKMPVFSFLYTLCFAPLFLLWKGCIDILGLSGVGTGQWGRSGRK